MDRLRTRASGALTGLLLVALAGCGADDSADASGPIPVDLPSATAPTPDDEPAAPPSPPTAAPQATDTEITLAVEVRPDDLPTEYGSENLFGAEGDLVDGYVTLDYCGADFPSEALRTARHQVAYATSGGESVATETVTYEPGGASQALAEVRDAILNCPQGFVESRVTGAPATLQRYEGMRVQRDWQDEALAFRVAITPENGAGRLGAFVFQVRGDVFTAVYVFAGPEDSAGLAARTASILSKRLAKVSPRVGAAA